MYFTLTTGLVILSSMASVLGRQIFVDVSHVHIIGARAGTNPTMIFQIGADGYPQMGAEGNEIMFDWDEDLPNFGGSFKKQVTKVSLDSRSKGLPT